MMNIIKYDDGHISCADDHKRWDVGHTKTTISRLLLLHNPNVNNIPSHVNVKKTKLRPSYLNSKFNMSNRINGIATYYITLHVHLKGTLRLR